MTSEEHFSSLNYLNFKVLLTLEINHLLQRTNVISKLFYGDAAAGRNLHMKAFNGGAFKDARMQGKKTLIHATNLQQYNDTDFHIALN